MADPVTATPPPTWWNDEEEHRRQIADALRPTIARVNDSLQVDGTEPMTGPMTLATYTVATLPTAATYPGAVIYVSDGAVGAKFRGSDGTSWVSLG